MMSGLLILPGNRELCCGDSYSIGRSEFCISGIDQVGAVDTQEVVPQEIFPLAYAGFVSSGYKDFPKYRETVTRLANRLTEEQKQTRQGKEILSYLQQVTKVSVGDTVPGHEYVDADGGKHYLSELRGKWLLLDFWSRGCGPCVGAVKELRQLSYEIGGKNL